MHPLCLIASSFSSPCYLFDILWALSIWGVWSFFNSSIYIIIIFSNISFPSLYFFLVLVLILPPSMPLNFSLMYFFILSCCLLGQLLSLIFSSSWFLLFRPSIFLFQLLYFLFLTFYVIPFYDLFLFILTIPSSVSLRIFVMLILNSWYVGSDNSASHSICFKIFCLL